MRERFDQDDYDQRERGQIGFGKVKQMSEESTEDSLSGTRIKGQ